MEGNERFVTRIQLDNCENCNPNGETHDRNCRECGGWGSKARPVKVRLPDTALTVPTE